MVSGVSGCFNRLQSDIAGHDDISIIDRADHRFRYWNRVAPQRLHSCAVDSPGTGQQFRWIDEMSSAECVYVDRNTAFGECTGSARMIKMDMRDAAGIEILDPHVVFGQCRFQVRHGVGWSCFDQDGGIAVANQIGTDRTGKIHVQQVEWNDF